MKYAASGAAVLGLLLAATCGGLASDAALAQDWEPEFAGGKLQPLPDGFPAGPITVVAAGAEDSAAGVLAQRLFEFSISNSPVKINVEFRPDFATYGSWDALKHAAEAEGGGEGYVNVIFESPDDLITLHTGSVTQDIGVGLDDLTEVVTVEDHRFVVVQCKEAGWEPTWEALVRQIKDHPGEVRYAGGAPGDRLDLTFAYYMDVQGLGGLYDKAAIGHVDAGDVAARTAAVVGCDADITVADMEQLTNLQKAKEVDMILVTGNTRLRGRDNDVPTAADVGMTDDPMSRTMQVVVPASVDPLHVRWLSALWAKTTTWSYFVARRNLDEPDNLSNVLDGEASAAWNDHTDAVIGALTEKLGLGAGQ